MHTVMAVTERLALMEKLRQFLSDERKAGREIPPMELGNGETVSFHFERIES